MPILDEAVDSIPIRNSSKATFVAEPQSLSPRVSATSLDTEDPPGTPTPHRQHRASVGKRLSGRPGPAASTASLNSTASLSSFTGDDRPKLGGQTSSYGHTRHHRHTKDVIAQVTEWLQHEKAKRAARRGETQDGQSRLTNAVDATKSLLGKGHNEGHTHQKGRHQHTSSSSGLSDTSLALEELEKIVATGMNLDGDKVITPKQESRGPYFSRRGSTRRRTLRKSSTVASSDTDYQDGDALVPSAEVVLDNSKTLGYTGGAAESQTDLLNPNKRSMREKESWVQFKKEIVRLAHTLRLKGWRQISLEDGGDIDVERLSGALTNAVYVVSPPAVLPQTPRDPQDSSASIALKKPPQKLLLRIYGPQAEHLIDRENELQILRRLARKKIGPRLLGTFTNGRFEQFFHARTLTAADLRVPETSKQIAKRMRELHDGIELLEQERDEGPFMWKNWDKWVDKCEEITTWVDHQLLSGKLGPAKTRSEEWKNRGLVCGVEWSIFRRTVERYRKWLEDQYNGPAGIRQHLVFAHNDTQYGNLLRLQPSGESPLLLPSNEHKQLIVIDFEYASANVPGLEFANHFTEWCYNYHSPTSSHSLDHTKYPTREEQHRFLRAYVTHQPHYPRPSLFTSPSSGPSSSISSFMLDSRAPPAQIAEEERERDEATESEIARLMLEARIWRVANSAQWVAWGIVQAKIPQMHHLTPPPPPPAQNTLDSDPLSPETAALAQDAHDKRPEEGGDEPEEEEFDYLGYAQERAMFFWGDVVQLGLVRREELPEGVRGRIKVVEY